MTFFLQGCEDNSTPSGSNNPIAGLKSFVKTIECSNGITLDEMLPCSDGGFLINGVSYSGFDYNPYIFSFKLSSNYNKEWARIIGDSLYEFTGKGIYSSGYYYYAGTRGLYPGGAKNAFLLKLDNDGTFLWARQYPGAGEDYFGSLCPAADGGVFMKAHINSGPNTGIFLMRIKPDGTVLWVKKYETFPGVAKAIASVDGGIILTGSNSSGTALIKLNSDGTTAWAKNFLVPGNAFNSVNICESPQGEIEIISNTGYLSQSSLCCIFSSAGSPITARKFSFASALNFSSCLRESDGTNIFAGTSTYYGEWIFTIASARDTGKITWAKSFSCGLQDNNSSLARTADGGYIAAINATAFGTGYKQICLVRFSNEGQICMNSGPLNYLSSSLSVSVSDLSIVGTDSQLTLTPMQAQSRIINVEYLQKCIN